jgi:membrane protein implicated in regulation of membrane protease activity
LPDWLTQLSAFTVFLGIGAIGFVFLLISLIFGELFEHFDHSFDHDHDVGGPSVLSSRVLSVFITAFGGFGALASNYGYSVLPSSAVGFGSGVVFGAIIYYFAKFLYGQQASTEVRSADIAGQTARVVVAIPGGGVGQVRLQVGEELIDKIAKSHDGSAVSANTLVKIQEVHGEMVVVRPQ